MKLLKSSIWSFLAVLVRGISALSINKFFAIQFGPPGIAVLSHFQNLITIVTTIPNDGVNRGVIRFLSSQETFLEKKRRYFATGFYLNLAFVLFTILFILCLKNTFLVEFESHENVLWVIVFSITMLLLVIDYFFLSIILAFRNTHHYFVVELLGSSLFFIIAYVGLLSKDSTINSVLIYYMIALAIGFLVVTSFILFHPRYREVISFRLNLNFGFGGLSKFVIMAISALVFGKLTDFIIRTYSFSTFTTMEVGLWQGAVKISDYYMMAFTSVTMIAFYPNITAALHNKKILKKAIFDGFKLFTPFIVLGCLTVYIFRFEFLEYLLEGSFRNASSLLSYQIVGDFLKMLSMLLSLILVAQSRLKLFIISELISAIIYIFSIYLLTPEYGIVGFSFAWIVRHIAYFIFLIFVYQKLLLTNE